MKNIAILKHLNSFTVFLIISARPQPVNLNTIITNILTVCYYLVTYAFQSESTLYSCLIVMENIWIINGSNPN